MLKYPVFGSDNETALTKAIEKAFPSSHRLICTQHLYTNCVQHPQHILGYCDHDRQAVVNPIFGTDGLAHATEILTSEIETAGSKWCYQKNTAPQFINYFHKRVVPMLYSNLTTKLAPGLPVPVSAHPWTNSNRESANHTLKQAIQWKPQTMIDLINALNLIVAT